LGGLRYDYRLGVVQCKRELVLGLATRVTAPCGTGLPILSAQYSACSVRLDWLAADSSQHSVTLYRQGPGADWIPLAVVTSDEQGRSVYEERQVSPGVQYAYRLGAKTPYCNETFSSEVAIAIPGVHV